MKRVFLFRERAGAMAGSALDQHKPLTSVRPVSWLVPFAVLAALAPSIGAAAVINIDAMFGANDRSIWTGAPGTSVDSGPRFLGPGGWNLGGGVGKVVEECLFGVCANFGAEVGARTSGRAGIGYGFKVDSGTFDIQYPLRAQFNVPTSVPGAPGVPPTVSIQTALIGLTGGLALPSQTGGPVTFRTGTLQVSGPDVQAHVDLAAELSAFAGARVCVGICYGPALGPFGFNESREIAAINRDGDGKIRVLGNTVANANQSINALNGLLNARFNLPDLDSSSAATPGGFTGATLTSSRRDGVAVLNVNIAEIAAKAVGLPIPLSGKSGPFGYNLLQANAGAFLDLKETLEFTPSATGRLVFSSDVRPKVGGVNQAPTRSIDFTLGQEVTFTPSGLGGVGVEPIIELGGEFRHSLDLVLGGNVDVKALGLNIAGLTLGPLVSERAGSGNLDAIDINLHTSTFHLGLGTIAGRPINLDFPGCVAFGAGEFTEFECAVSGYGGGVSFPAGDGFHEDEIEQFQCSSHEFGELPSCGLFNAGFTSPYFPGPFGDVFVGSADARIFDPISPGPSTTNAGQQRALADLGYTGAPEFIIPPGDPLSAFPASEPATAVLLGLGLAGLFAGRASRTKARAKGASPV